MNDIIQSLVNFLSGKDNQQASIDEVLDLLEDEFIDLRQLRQILTHQSQIQMNEETLQLTSQKKQSTQAKAFTPKQRTALVENLEKRLIGPQNGEQETLKAAPSSYYLTGRLFPYGASSNVIHEEETDQPLNEVEGITVEGEAIEEIITSQDQFRNSSMGVSFILNDITPLTCHINWARYESVEEDNSFHYKRRPFSKTISLDLKQSGELSVDLDSNLLLKWYVRPGKSGLDISLYLVHSLDLSSTNRFPRQEEIIFQPQLSFSINKQSIVPRPAYGMNNLINFLYRERTVPIIGHQIGTDWSVDDTTYHFTTTWLPKEEVPLVEHQRLTDTSFNMLDLAKQPKDEVISRLNKLPDAYMEWIKKESTKLDGLSEMDQSLLLQQVEQARETCSRMYDGIRLLETNDKAWTGFRLSNLAMHIQREQGIHASVYKETGQYDFEPVKSEWRLFQLAFILMNLPSSFDEQHEDRQLVDLLWFPTGGGKTEAYLGLAAFVMFVRRLKNDVSNPMSYGGMSVMMRYTLRLLTIQQFQRATLLICAMEAIRRHEDTYSKHISDIQLADLGTVPFSIGLWIGSASTPNNYDDAKIALQKLESNEPLENGEVGNPMQLSHCPWCGEKLTVRCYSVDRSKATIKCPKTRCTFHSGIPAYTIDEAIYDHLPSLVIGTVDKLAQIAWQPRIGELFGRKSSYRVSSNKFIGDSPTQDLTQQQAWLPPADLVIQDELHLLNGPLGSLTGLYEFVIDELMGFGESKPKIVASTATISGAESQIRGLYDRPANQFPVYIQSPDDSFFSKTVPIDQKPGRLYVGVSSPGVSMKIHTVNVYGALIAATRKQEKQAELDPYWTVVGYFNTIRELAGTNTMFYDEIRTYLQANEIEEPLLDFEELTSRKKAQEIPELLARMERSFENDEVLDAVLCTNMISVGVDVNRLGLMVVHGQPKTTAEYIQATSRVGRQHPGLVVTILNPQRTRDLFHFEQFKSFHQSFYQYVEPTSVTPFSKGALKRGITGVLVGLIRQTMTSPPISKANSAGQFNLDAVDASMIDRFVARAKSVYDCSETETRQLVSEVLDTWESLANRTNHELAYRQKIVNGRPMNTSHHLLKYFEETPYTHEAMFALTSLRSVEPEIKVEEEVNRYDSW